MAQPALKATLNAGASPYLALYVVLKLVSVAMTIPTAPQTIEIMAPIANAIAVITPSAVRKVITMNITATKIMHIRYSCFKNSTAP